MSILLSILKLIGIILLVLIGLAVLVVGLVLFVPVRYYISGQIEDEITVHVKLSWLLQSVYYTLDYQNKEINSCLRILGIRKKPAKKSALDEEPDEDEEWPVSDVHDVEEVTDYKASKDVSERLETVVETKCTDAHKAEIELQERQSAYQRLVYRVRAFFSKIRAKIDSFFEILHTIKTTIPEICGKASNLKAMLTDEWNQFVVLQVLGEVKYLLAHFKFRKLHTDLQFATGDPATTGQALGVLCMLPILYQYQVSIVPDFESDEFYIKGTFDIKGRMRACHVLKSLVRLILKKEVRIFIKKIIDR